MKVIAGISVVAFAALGAAGLAGCSQEAQAKSEARQKIALCEKDLADPGLPESSKVTIIRPVCERFKAEFREKYRADP